MFCCRERPVHVVSTVEFSRNKYNIFEHFSFSVDPGQDPLRIDKFLMNRVENASRNKIFQ